MTQKSDILNELNELNSSLAGVNPVNRYSVPSGYFEGLADQVMSRIKAMEAANAAEELGYLSPFLNGIEKQNPFTVPVGYFEGLEKQVLQAVNQNKNEQTASEELAAISPFLSGIKKQLPYDVPQGYFENLSHTIVKEPAKPVVKVISLTSRKWFRYAAAAVVIGVIAMAGFTFLNKDNVNPETNSYGWVKKNTKKVSTENLNKFVELTEEVNLVASTDTKVPEEVKDLVKDVPEKEIQSLLNDTQLLDDTNTEPASDDKTMMN